MSQAQPSRAEPARIRLRLLSYNIQAGVGTSRYHHYLTHSWRHLLPHRRGLETLDRIAQLIQGYDVVALQETDAGSLRSNFINQTEYLATKARFPFHHYQVNRNMGKLAQHSNSVLSKFKPAAVSEHRLPGLIPGRGAMMVRFGHGDHSLALFVLHLALGRRARMSQLAYISEHVNSFENVVLMGDMNCQPHSPEMRVLFGRTRLQEPHEVSHTFPSWRPNRHIDHILVTPSLVVEKAQVLHHTYSDHLPVSVELSAPAAVQLQS